MERILVMGDLYNSLFSAQVTSPDVLVDYQVWNQIKAGLPQYYVMPDPNMTSIISDLRRKYG
ncbi:hypothetical protein ERICIV_04467 [Paenibacillus larvae subsp. larvae]|uniref:Uncharacterized protein n=2 Tax=Paenibacillus larvae TaxID=1464 RepID=A0A1V0UTK5_9BACL|nr:hypothetical protein [Paenibacillus larvae]AQT84953.1 hypothetical protein B1222_12040 [Paenibacillus larvae subsp. pulvifaciens]AQZ46956.1 hypothetical protein B5S25_10475 [Paenibacillus larvae subsp. pulvifaciens]ARF68330.1 hypothetical protein B7C51_11690 [Paenibacillus larvae subsp. pulvifaciens]AVF28730.1 hypothetical protein ERICIII_04721 [Paenibacillus larvae subsp. larvae]AVF33236.1 hypothetical protein ERICIV_04467 [Paenibacillus larvae subsp. larvae]